MIPFAEQKEVNIVEVIENEKGIAVKYDNGLMECFMTKTETISITTTWGALYSYNQGQRTEFPVAFKEKPKVFLSVCSDYAMLASFEGEANNVSAPKVDIFRATQVESMPITINLSAIGKWK